VGHPAHAYALQVASHPDWVPHPFVFLQRKGGSDKADELTFTGSAAFFCFGAKLLPVITKLLPIAILIAMVTPAGAQGVSRPDVPDKIKAPAGEEVVLEAHATGSQIYVCQTRADGQFAWNLKAPDAELRDQSGGVIGHHFAGPAWKDSDGSEVTGKAVAKVDSPDPNAIPWLLVTATGHSGNGVLSRVTSIQRIRTKGGLAPPADECNAAKQNVEVRSSYTADYYFYAPAK